MRGESAANERSTDNHKIMKSDSTPSQSGPSSPPFLTGPPRTQLESLLDPALEHAEDAMREDGALSPALFVASPEGLFLLGSGPWEDLQQKDNFVANARLLCAAHAATAVVLAYETWGGEAGPGERLLPDAPPSESPRRKEFIVLSGEAAGGHSQQRWVPILRDGQGRFSCLRAVVVPPAKPAEGPPTHLLPEVPPTQEVRALAKSMLKVRGLNFVDATSELP